ncbi:hypothetical protein [Halalkalibacter lacteus]
MQLPIIIFLSLITNDYFIKEKRWGADAQISKPEIVQLVETINN